MAMNSLKRTLYDINGNPITVTSGNLQVIATDITSGTLQTIAITSAGAIVNLATTDKQDSIIATLSGMATEAKQDSIISNLSGISVITDTPKFFEDTNFQTGDSPATLDFNATLGRNAREISITNDGPGNFTVDFSTNGSSFYGAITMKSEEILAFDKLSIDSLRITWVASDSAYRVVAI